MYLSPVAGSMAMLMSTHFKPRTKSGSSSPNLVLSVMSGDRLKHSEIVVSPEGSYRFGEDVFNSLDELVSFHQKFPILYKRKSGEKVEIFLTDQISDEKLYLIQPWYIPNLAESTVNR